MVLFRSLLSEARLSSRTIQSILRDFQELIQFIEKIQSYSTAKEASIREEVTAFAEMIDEFFQNFEDATMEIDELETRDDRQLQQYIDTLHDFYDFLWDYRRDIDDKLRNRRNGGRDLQLILNDFHNYDHSVSQALQYIQRNI